MADIETSSRPHQRVTLRQIAKEIGVTHVTVSLALRNHPRISESLRQTIQAKAREMGYVPDPMLSALASYRNSRLEKPVQAALAWLNCWPNPRDLLNFHEFDCYWQGATEAAGAFGYRLEEFRVNQEMPLSRLTRVLRARNIMGILLPPQPPGCTWAGLDWEKFSVIQYGRGVGEIPPFHLVTSAQAYNAALALQKMRENGYDRVGLVAAKTSIWTYLGGFLQAQLIDLSEEQRLPPMIYDEDVKIDELSAWLKKWKPDAILSEKSAILDWLKATGYAPKRKIGVAGLNILDMPLDAGIYQNPREIGRVGVLVLISLINDHDLGSPSVPREILVKGNWVNGQSLPKRA